MAHVNEHVANDNYHLDIVEKAAALGFSSGTDNVAECFELTVYSASVRHVVVVQRVWQRVRFLQTIAVDGKKVKQQNTIQNHQNGMPLPLHNPQIKGYKPS
eukprot:2687750-Ditylum_brightwellii.AAC.1